MNSKILLTSDLHFDNKSINEYRWTIFPWLCDICKEYNVSTIIICGDLFHNKDNHPSSLVNRFIDNLKDLLQFTGQIMMLKGNHDLVEHTNPYLRWINNIPNIRFFIKPETILIDGKKFLFLPNSFDPLNEWQQHSKEITNADYIFCHQTFEGSVSEGGMKLSGISQSIFSNTRAKIFSGDIHKSQKLGKITYIGTPYPINFGDKSVFRTILLDLEIGTEKNLFFKTVKKHTITISSPEELAGLVINKHDQVKFRLALDDIVNWEKYKSQITDYCKAQEINYHQIEFIKKDSSLSLEAQKARLKILSPKEILMKYIEMMQIGPETAQFGMGILEGQTNDSITTVPDKSD